MSELVPIAPSLPEALAQCLALRGQAVSRAVLQAHLGMASDRAQILQALSDLGISASEIPARVVSADLLPIVALMHDRSAVAVTGLAEDRLVSASGAVVDREQVALCLGLGPARSTDSRADELVADSGSGWFWPVLWRHRRYFQEAAALSAVINILSLAGIIFMMTVYDRILPNLAFVTLWSLLGGVGVALVFEFISRTIRSHALDAAGKKIDLILGDAVFARVLATRLEARAQSSGAFANVLKEFESVRGFVASATLVTIADLPFALMFLGVCAMIGGALVAVPLVAFVTVLALSLLVQIPMARLARENLREAAVRHGTVIESLEGLETLKALRAEERMRRRHEMSSGFIADRALVSQRWSNLALNLTTAVQQGAAAIMLAWGVYLASTGQATAGALVACVQLNSRALAPLVTLSGLAVRFQQVRSALSSLNRIMALPLDRDAGRHLLSSDGWRGDVELRGASFRYEEGTRAALDNISLKIRPGERIAVLGRIGSGKSTLLRLLAALYRPQEGQVLLDGVDMTAIEPADIRATLLLVGQDARLFHGSLRDNLLVAAPRTSDPQMLKVAEATGVTALAATHPLGFDRGVGERGDTLSGGQRQAVAVARALLADARIYLFDEPTSAMDQQSEAELLRTIAGLAERGAGYVIVTHKHSVLAVVDRVIVMDAGCVVADGPREAVLKALSDGKVRTAA
ncbi:type I secretion system permease/ATPase [Sphingobium bisphenolivorans]|uniref:type I secretion system permease/ATPase n=1 Tax=Sphingobium bisphenolivorans TaxID=1335760 RepID=UPI00039B9B8F|nr:type I secretion system permease/ATPase [Sphingobium bisphenolivorans]